METLTIRSFMSRNAPSTDPYFDRHVQPLVCVDEINMSTFPFGFPSLRPSHTEEEWFPRLESDDIAVVADLEDAIIQQKEKILNYPCPTYIGASAPEEEDDATVDEDDDQEEKRRDAGDGIPGFRAAGAAGEVDVADGDGEIGMDHETADDEDYGVEREEDEEVDEEEVDEGEIDDNNQILSEDDVYTGDDDVEMEEDEGGDLGSEEFDFEFVGELSDSIDL